MLTPTFKDLTRQRAFMRFWFARLFGTTGNQMLMVAVGWQMYELTGSAWDLGLVGLYQFAPALLLTLVAGHVADRVHRGRIIAACLVGQTAVALSLVAATQGWGGSASWASRELLLGLSVMLGVGRAFQMPAQQALTPPAGAQGLVSACHGFQLGRHAGRRDWWSRFRRRDFCGRCLGGLRHLCFSFCHRLRAGRAAALRACAVAA